MLAGLDVLRTKQNMCIILLAHAKVETFSDPEVGASDRFSPRLHKHANAVLTEWADVVLFATRKIITKTEDAGFNRNRTLASGLGKGSGERVMRCFVSPGCIAKNRYSLPTELPLSLYTLIEAMMQADIPTSNQTTKHKY